MSLREDRFIKFVVSLWENHSECFNTNYNIWTEKYDGEEWFFSVFLRTLVCNDSKTENLFKEIGGYRRVREKFRTLTQSEVEDWYCSKAFSITVGCGTCHRKPFHKKDNPHILHGYLNLVKESQIEFVKGKSFKELRNQLKSVDQLGKLLAFDILQRLYRTRHNYVTVYPLKAYDSGGGPIRGLKLIYGKEKKQKELMILYQRLGEKIQAITDIPTDIFWFELEDILCIYQKKEIKSCSESMLSSRIYPSLLADLYAELYCKEMAPKY